MNKKLCYLSLSIYMILLKFDDTIGKQSVSDITCLPISKCPIYFNMLSRKPVSAAAVDQIRAAHCKFEGLMPYVWCVSIENKPGINNGGNVTSSTVVNVETTSMKTTLKEPVTKVPTDTRLETEEASTVLPSIDECGKQESDDRILGGSETRIDEFPWLAILQFYSPRKKKLYNGCGGVLISNKYILTAAHCITQPAGSPLSILLGEYDTKNKTDCENDGSPEKYCTLPPVSVAIDSIYIHPNWQKDRRSGDDDIALIRMATTVNFTEFVKPICLPNVTRNTSETKHYVVAGWGRTETGKISNIKLKVNIPFVPNDVCTMLLNRPINDGIICAGGVKGKDSCRGDSGGPLMYIDIHTGTWTAAGIVSIGPKGCGREEIPAIYTNVTKYMDWILQTILP